jgi:hypothetical protein
VHLYLYQFHGKRLTTAIEAWGALTEGLQAPDRERGPSRGPMCIFVRVRRWSNSKLIAVNDPRRAYRVRLRDEWERATSIVRSCQSSMLCLASSRGAEDSTNMLLNMVKSALQHSRRSRRSLARMDDQRVPTSGSADE